VAPMLRVPDLGLFVLVKVRELEPVPAGREGVWIMEGAVPVGTGRETFACGMTPLGLVERGGNGAVPGAVPVGTGRDAFNDGVSPLGAVENGGYGTGPPGEVVCNPVRNV